MNDFFDTEEEEMKAILLDSLEDVHSLMQYQETLKNMEGDRNSIKFTAVQTLLNQVVKTSCTWVGTNYSLFMPNACTV